MSQETKRERRGSDRAGRHCSEGVLLPHGSGGVAGIVNATNSETLKHAPTDAQSMTAAAKAIARWENEGGRVVESGPVVRAAS